jgi:hypothetical protein
MLESAYQTKYSKAKGRRANACVFPSRVLGTAVNNLLDCPANLQTDRQEKTLDTANKCVGLSDMAY